MERITSLSNPRVKAIRKLRDRKERQQSGLFYVEGVRIVAEAVQLPENLETLIVAPELLTSDFAQNLMNEQIERGVPVLEVSSEVFETISLKEGPTGLAAVMRQNWNSLSAVDVKEGQTWVALDAVADPGNLGTILRTHDAVGGMGVILLDNATDPYDPTSIRASMGAIFSQNLIRASFSEFASWKQSINVPLIGTSDKAKTHYHRCIYPSACVLIMGSERQGLQPQHLQLCDEVVRIPMVGRSDSLNLAVATGIVLYEIFNQHHAAAEA
jgi:TrmH family RNA methyltransferase